MALWVDATLILLTRLELAAAPWQPAHFESYRLLPVVGTVGVTGVAPPVETTAPLK